jgi:hypothetical protein
VIPPPGAVIATSGKAFPGGEDLDEQVYGDLFASDRRPLPGATPAPPAAREAVAVNPIQPASAPPPAAAPPAADIPGLVNWIGLYPVAPPPVAEGMGGLASSTAHPVARFYGGAEYLLWWGKADRAPILATTGSAFIPGDVNAPPPGALDTRVLHDGRLGHGGQSGARFTAGWFFDECGAKAIEASFFFLGQGTSRFATDSSQNPVIARPFFDTVLGRENVEIVAFPGFFNGRLAIDSTSELWGVEANVLCCACRGCGWRVSWLAGPRFLSLRESLTITEVINPINPADPLAGSTFTAVDRFTTSNQFYGVQAGVEGRWLLGRWTVDGRAKLALGVTSQSVDVQGGQSVVGAVNPDPRPGGLLALPSNSGPRSRGTFGVVPEVGVSLGYYVTDWMRLSAGYNFLFWSNVARPGGQIDRNINSNQLPNFNVPPVASIDPPPARLLNGTSYYAHGLTFGVELNF